MLTDIVFPETCALSPFAHSFLVRNSSQERMTQDWIPVIILAVSTFLTLAVFFIRNHTSMMPKWRGMSSSTFLLVAPTGSANNKLRQKAQIFVPSYTRVAHEWIKPRQLVALVAVEGRDFPCFLSTSPSFPVFFYTFSFSLLCSYNQ